MGILSSIFAIFKKIFKAIFKLLKKLFKEFWPLILLVAGLYFFGPAIGGWLSSIDAPGWITSIFTGFPGSLSGLGSSVLGLLGEAGTAFMGAELSTQATIVGGGALLLAPEETGQLIRDVAEVGGDIIGDVIGGAAGGLTPLILMGFGGFLLYKVLTKDDNKGTTA